MFRRHHWRDSKKTLKQHVFVPAGRVCDENIFQNYLFTKFNLKSDFKKKLILMGCFKQFRFNIRKFNNNWCLKDNFNNCSYYFDDFNNFFYKKNVIWLLFKRLKRLTNYWFSNPSLTTAYTSFRNYGYFWHSLNNLEMTYKTFPTIDTKKTTFMTAHSIFTTSTTCYTTKPY